ncbi:hypothetical protein [Bradyrhizobium sp.]|uniref:hypothetical protein n=1 Tax=Bradyrhizobium sp. TaxID=376 RepID=UPI003BAF5FE3
MQPSRNLFGLVKRFHDNMPDDYKPSLGTSNAEELVFDKLDSGYLVSAATLEGAGRSSTAQLLHASEAAFWPSLQEQLAALMQTVPDIDGCEIVIEQPAINSAMNFIRSGAALSLAVLSSRRSFCPGRSIQAIALSYLMASR